jgi:hypothetical protein
MLPLPQCPTTTATNRAGWHSELDSRLVPGAPSPLNVLWLVDHGFLRQVS